MFQIALCDDIPADLECTRLLVEEYRLLRPSLEISVSVFDSAYQLLAEMDQGKFHDIYLLDILMPDFSGLQLGRTLRDRNNKCSIIFGTITPEYALESYSVSAQNYLLKPFDREKLFRALDQAVRYLGYIPDQGLTIRTEQGIHYVPAHEIVHIESRQRALICHTVDGQSITSLKLRQKFEKALAPLLALPRFCHPHKSHVVNMEHIRFHGGDRLTMADGTQIPVSPSHKKEVLERYLDYVSQPEDSSPRLPRS